jgi:hypothetical protein
MTTPALVKAADLKRMADVANSKGVTVWVESTDGRRVGVSPNIHSERLKEPIAKYEDFDL